MLRWLVALALAFSTALVFGAAYAQTEKGKLSGYEKETVRRALERTGYEEDTAPEGKWVESIEVVTFEVFEDRDYLPTTFPSESFNVAGVANWFHTVSKPWVIRREVLLRPGKRFDWSLVNESERNLRVRQISVIVIRPVRGSQPDRVRLLVITKDVWSLRINTAPRFVNGGLDYLALQPSEENLFGLHKTVTGLVELSRATYSLGLGYIDPRVGGSRLLATVDGNVVFNCQTDNIEGTFGSLTYGKPLYSTRTRWSWVAALAWSNRIIRPGGTSGASICSGGRSALIDFLETPEVEDDVRYEYDQDFLLSQYSVTRSFGIWHKTEVSFGLESRRVATEPLDLSGHSPFVQREFQKLLPTDDMRIGPFAQLHAWRNKFHRVMDAETLGLQEDYQLGYDVWLRVYPAASALGSSRTMLGMFNGVAYTVPLADGFARAHVDHRAELARPERVRPEPTAPLEEQNRTDAAVETGVRIMTPRLVFVRGVADVLASHRYINYLNPFTSLGGTDRLRGYRMSAFVGSDLVVGNFEIRTMPLRLPGLYVGAVAFWDMGDATRGWDQLDLKHAYGGGLRVLLPQLDRAVFRVDVGFPLDPDVDGAERTIVAQFQQAFGVPRVSPPALVSSTSLREGISTAR